MLGFEPTDEAITDTVIDGAQMILGVNFPDAYRKMIREFSGAHGDVECRVDRPSPGFDTIGIGLLHSLHSWNPESLYDVLTSWPEHELDRRIVPFGEDGGGNYICFDFRASDAPSVVFYFHELPGVDGIMKVCDSFGAFLERLQLPDDA
jgi:hypothetical protein